MALATSTVVALAAAAAAAGVNQYNTNRTITRQDNEQASGIRQQGKIQERADQRVNEEVTRLEASTSADEKAKRMSEFATQLTRARGKTDAGLSNDALGDAFNTAGKDASARTAASGATTANFLAGIDAPGLQRQGEASSFGRLATDLALTGRESQGQRFLTDLRTRGIRRSGGLDILASTLGGVASGAAGAGGGASAGAGAASGFSNDQLLAAMRGFGT